MTVDIVPVKLSELELLQRISRLTFFETFSNQNSPENMRKYLNEHVSLEKLQQEYTNPLSFFYFAKINENIVGYLKINFATTQTMPNNSDSLEIERIYVLNSMQKNGVGKQLLEKAIEISRNEQLTTIWLGVWEHNKNAIEFYNHLGFIEFGKHPFQLGDDTQTDLLMKLFISN
ncbi:MAG: GNAT family N-acetyltransferase [Crocinitomicaceae bacterium]|nr:GNAT family N-acetyltransferase [Crocinitomicaceae bacterium]